MTWEKTKANIAYLIYRRRQPNANLLGAIRMS